MTDQEREEFILYLQACTDSQVQGVYDKEFAAGRSAYVQLERDEARRRGLTWESFGRPV